MNSRLKLIPGGRVLLLLFTLFLLLPGQGQGQNKLQVDFRFPDFICQKDSVFFTNLSLPSACGKLSFQWTFGDAQTGNGQVSTKASPTHKFLRAGKHRVTLKVVSDQGCRDSLSKDINIVPSPRVVFTMPGICYTDEIKFGNATTLDTAEDLAYLWDFGDGTFSVEKEPLHRYARTGRYKVTLKAVSARCQDESSQFLTVNATDPQAGFAVPNQPEFCQKDGVPFTDRSRVSYGQIVYWNWDFGDGTTSTSQNPHHVYAAPGEYEVTLRASSGIGCSDVSARQRVKIIPSPNARFMAPEVCFGDPVAFTQQSDFPYLDRRIIAYAWDFGDGTSSALADPPGHLYARPGTYAVKLTVTASNGCQDRITRNVVVHPPPVADFPAEVCIRETAGESEPLRDASSVAGNAAADRIVDWQWEFADGSRAAGQQPRHPYVIPGVFPTRLTVTSAFGCRHTVSKQLEVRNLPLARAGADQPDLCGVSSTTLAAVPPTGPAVGSWTLVSGTGGLFTDASRPDAVFTGIPNTAYTLRWTTTNGGCQTSDEVQVRFYSRPQAQAGADQLGLCGRDSTLLTAVTPEGPYTGDWTLVSGGEGHFSDPTKPDAVFRGRYNTLYTLRWTVRNGPCQTSDEVQVRFDARPLALAGPDRTNLCGVTSVYLAANIPPAPATGQWEVIGGSGGSFSNAADPGTAFTGLLQQHYTLRWTVRNGACPEEKDEVQVRFNPIPSVDAGPDGEITAGETWPLKASGDGLYAWTPATGLSNPAVADPLAAPTQSTTYVLTLTSAAGCTAVDSVFVKVYPRLEIPTAFSPNGDGTHDVWSIPGFKEYSQARLDVFDRLGNKVFSGDHTSAWNGTHKGQSLPMDTYFYVIHPNNGKKPIVGSISIIK